MEHSHVAVRPLGRVGRCYALTGLFTLEGGALQKVSWLWSFASLALMLSHSIQLTPPPIQKTLLAHACFVSEGRETRDSTKCYCCSLCVYLLFVKLCLLVHRFVSAIHFTAAVQHNLSAVRLIKDDLTLSCKGRELTLQRS